MEVCVKKEEAYYSIIWGTINISMTKSIAVTARRKKRVASTSDECDALLVGPNQLITASIGTLEVLRLVLSYTSLAGCCHTLPRIATLDFCYK